MRAASWIADQFRLAGMAKVQIDTFRGRDPDGHSIPMQNVVAIEPGHDGWVAEHADIAEAINLPLPQHSAAQVADLRTQLPNFATISNPLDYNTSLWGHQDLLTRCFDTVMRGDYDAGMLVIDYATDGKTSELAWNASVHAIVAACKQNGKLPIVTATLPELLPDGVRQMFFRDPDCYWIEVNDALKDRR